MWDNQRPHGEGQWKRSTDRRDGPDGLKPRVWHKTGLVGERELQHYVPRSTERTNCK